MKVKSGMLLALLAICTLLIYPYYRDWRRLKEADKTAVYLKENERQKFIIENRTVTTVTKRTDGTLKVKVNPNARKTAITVKDDGTIDYYSPIWGFVFEPGYTAFYTDDKLWYGADVEWFYFKRWGVTTGFGLATRNQGLKVRFNVLSVNYNLPFRILSNTSLLIGLDDKKEFLAGIRVRW